MHSPIPAPVTARSRVDRRSQRPLGELKLARGSRAPASRVARGGHAGGESGAERLLAAFAAFDTFPALRQSRDAMLTAANAADPDRTGLVAVVESDPALAISVLRAAARNGAEKERPADVPSALRALSATELEAAAGRLSVFDFFQQSHAWSQTAERFRLHARMTQAAAEYVRRTIGMRPRPDLRAAALLHDIGKLVLLRAHQRYERSWDTRATPADRLALERVELGLDHAMAGGVLARRLGLAGSLARTIEHHHNEDAHDDAAIIRVADMLAHYMTGGPVDPAALSAAAGAVGLSPQQLRGALDELPGGAPVAQTAGPSPLTTRETDMVRKLADGKVYKQIAADFGLTVSTVRTHLYNTYRKLGVSDRAQAVLLATSRGWL